MEEDKNLNRRRKSIMVIDKKGQTKELAKDDQGVSTLIDTTDKTPKDRILSPQQDLSMNKSESLMNKSESLMNKKEDVMNTKDDTFNKREDSLNKDDTFNEKEDLMNDNVKDNAEDSLNDIINSTINHQSSVHSEKKTLNMRNAEIAAGATAGTAAGIISKQESEDKHVTIDEEKNEEHEVESDANRAIPLTEEEKSDIKAKSPAFIPQRIPSHDLVEGSEIQKERDDNNVEAEGHIWKRRRIFACFWHEKYFLLTKGGLLKYHKANGTKAAKGNWDLKKFNRVHEVFMGGESHPFRLALMNSDENLLLGFDDSDNREYWLTKLSKYINNN